MNEENIACCGVNCTACPDYRAETCPNCRRTVWPEDDPCPPVACCREKKIRFCGECRDFPCGMMKEFYAESESHERAYHRMCVLRQSGQ